MGCALFAVSCAWESCAEQENYLTVHACSIAASMYMFCLAWSIVHRVDVIGSVSFRYSG